MIIKWCSFSTIPTTNHLDVGGCSHSPRLNIFVCIVSEMVEGKTCTKSSPPLTCFNVFCWCLVKASIVRYTRNTQCTTLKATPSSDFWPRNKLTDRFNVRCHVATFVRPFGDDPGIIPVMSTDDSTCYIVPILMFTSPPKTHSIIIQIVYPNH